MILNNVDFEVFKFFELIFNVDLIKRYAGNISTKDKISSHIYDSTNGPKQCCENIAHVSRDEKREAVTTSSVNHVGGTVDNAKANHVVNAR